ncbi:hypothetical protein GCM10011506_19020 [Marivirga lumbricoides]|uniref:Uncharacterized protein n=1 Tax=Marivirga lumbricoides TaxID=1046115 RepID=A0ABQ1M2R1_9BACT|nr:hypothetical protein GCM10011506_19020 [Marivirga lumbricoides]
MKILVGILIGWLSLYFFAIVKKNIGQKKGIKSKEYANLAFTARLRDSIRHIIFEYDIKRKNNDFLLNIKIKEKLIMQLMHRAHFPELCQSESDINFGLALYIPVNGWEKEQVLRLDKIVSEESETVRMSKSGQIEYYVIDLGKRVRFSGYFLTRIIKEVFEADENQFNSSLYSEGNLPYHLN